MPSPSSSPHEGERVPRLERQAVADACASPAPLVIACGGGAVLDADNRRRLHQRGSWCGCKRRRRRSWRAVDDRRRAAAARGGDRPPPSSGSRSCARAAYEAAAHALVDTDGRTVDEVADAVLEEYRR